MKSKESILFLGKNGDDYSRAALSFLRENFESVQGFCGDWGDPLPPGAASWHGDYIISYLSRWVVPQSMLDCARKAAINFHPASPDFPGIGCTNFALYSGSKEYGVTCHHMARVVDTGPIIAVRRFGMNENDTVATLLERTYQAQFDLFLEIGWKIRSAEKLTISGETWTRRPYTRKEFNDLNRILPGMSAEEEALRVRSCAFGKYSPVRITPDKVAND